MPSPDDWMFNPPPNVAAAPADEPQPAASEPGWKYPFSPDVIRTIAGEGDPKAVATVLHNREVASGLDYDTLTTQPNQFEARTGSDWAHNSKLPVTSHKFQQVLADAGPILTGDQPPLGPWDSFYSPQGQIVKGRKNADGSPVVPDFAAKAEAAGQHGVNIGGNVFYATGWNGSGTEPPGEMTAAQQMAWDKAFPNARYQPGSAGAHPPDVPNPQAATFGFLANHGFRDENAPLGSPTNPAGQLPGGGVPSEQGSWYVTPDGKLRQTGDQTDDYLPQYQRLVQFRGSVAKGLGTVGMAGTGLGQGAIDIGQGIDKFFGGAPGGTFKALTGEGFNLGALAHESTAQNQQERDAYNLLFGGSPVAAAGRFVGQAAPVTALTAGTMEGLGALGPAGEFAAGEGGGGNALLQGLSRATSGAIQGGEAGALTSATTDRPVEGQIATGAALGAGLSTVSPLVVNAGRRMVMGGGDIPKPVADLADAAINDYGIPLRGGQIKAASGDRQAGYADSTLLGSSPKFQANNAEQHAARMRAITGAYGDPSGDVSPAAMEDAQQRIVGVMGDVAGRTTIADAKTSIADRLDEVVQHADAVLGDDELKPLQKLVTNIKSTIGPDGTMSGASWRALTQYNSQLQAAIRKGGSDYPGQIYGIMQDALSSNAPQEDAAALNAARWQYKNWVAVSKASPSANLGVIPPGALKSGVNQTFKNQSTMGAGQLGDIVAIDKAFMKEPPQSGSVPRAKEALGPLSYILGAGGEGLAFALHDPQLAIGTAAGVAGTAAARKGLQALKEARLGPGAAKALINPQVNPLYQPPVTLLPSATLGAKNLLLTNPNQ